MAQGTLRYQILVKSISLLLLVLFVYAATSKLLLFDQFKIQLSKSPFISDHAGWLALIIPFMEYVISGLFLFPKYVLTALYASFSILLLFTLYIFLVLNFSTTVPCSCGGIIANLDWKEHFVFNTVCILLSLIGISSYRKLKQHQI
tara:strand:- start:638 stop:1075 length:438 start_codon:yes stop_codon:yes gene_type:complete